MVLTDKQTEELMKFKKELKETRDCLSKDLEKQRALQDKIFRLENYPNLDALVGDKKLKVGDLLLFEKENGKLVEMALLFYGDYDGVTEFFGAMDISNFRIHKGFTPCLTELIVSICKTQKLKFIGVKEVGVKEVDKVNTTPPSISDYLDKGDVLIALEGVFVRFGRPAKGEIDDLIKMLKELDFQFKNCVKRGNKND